MGILTIVLYVVGALVVCVLLFLASRLISVSRGMGERDDRIVKMIDPLGERLDAGEEVTAADVDAIASRPETRYLFYAGLRHMNRAELIPRNYDSEEKQAESALAYWLMHPHELQDAPAEMEHVEAVTRTLPSGERRFHIFKFRMPEGNWAAEKGWLLGIVGPLKGDEVPYEKLPQAFSRSDKVGSVTNEELVDWWVDMLGKKGMPL